MGRAITGDGRDRFAAQRIRRRHLHSRRKEQYMNTAASTVGRSLLAVAVLVAAALTVALIVPTPASGATQATYYVAPNGNDAFPGTLTSPFRTLQHARDIVR